MDWEAFYKKIDAQIELIKQKAAKSPERRQQQVAVVVERRSGKERRGISRAISELVSAEGCGGNCQQGRLTCTCRDK